MKTFTNCPRFFHEVRNVLLRYYNVGCSDGLLLVEAPHVELMDRFNTGDLEGGVGCRQLVYDTEIYRSGVNIPSQCHA